MTMSDRIAVMRAGRIEQVGAPEEVYEFPATGFVAGFLGASNLLPGTVEARDGDQAVVILASGDKVRVPADRVPEGLRDARLGVRPEKIRIRSADASPADGQNTLPGTVVVSTYVGVSNQYSVRTATGNEVIVYAQNLDAPGEYVPGAGEEVVLTWHPDHTFVVTPE